MKKMRLIALILSMLLLASCASMSSKFNKTKGVNLAPFAAQTISMIGSVDYSMSSHELLYLNQIKDYVDEDKPFERYFVLENQVKLMVKRMVAYSIQLVAISEQRISEKEKVNALADMIVVLAGDVINAGNIPFNIQKETFDKTIQRIRSSSTYMQGIEQSAPLVNAFSDWSGRVLDALREEKFIAGEKLAQAVMKKYATTIAFTKELRLARDRFAHDLIALAKYAETNDQQYLQELRRSTTIPVRLAVKGKTRLSLQDILSLHKDMTQRMAMLNENFGVFRQDVENYHRSMLELDQLVSNKASAIKSARLLFIAWSRAYGKMAAGILSPAEWFDIRDTGPMLLNAVRRVARI